MDKIKAGDCVCSPRLFALCYRCCPTESSGLFTLINQVSGLKTNLSTFGTRQPLKSCFLYIAPQNNLRSNSAPLNCQNRYKCKYQKLAFDNPNSLRCATVHLQMEHIQTKTPRWKKIAAIQSLTGWLLVLTHCCK